VLDGRNALSYETVPKVASEMALNVLAYDMKRRPLEEMSGLGIPRKLLEHSRTTDAGVHVTRWQTTVRQLLS
jgi:hypothetical protein